jgi:hypothetical protein
LEEAGPHLGDYVFLFVIRPLESLPDENVTLRAGSRMSWWDRLGQCRVGPICIAFLFAEQGEPSGLLLAVERLRHRKWNGKDDKPRRTLCNCTESAKKHDPAQGNGWTVLSVGC